MHPSRLNCMLVARAVPWIALLAGCAADPAPRPVYTSPPQARNAPVKPLDEAREDRQGEVADDRQ